MRTGSAVAVLGAFAMSCGGGNSSPGALSHPTLDQDYTSTFAGTWQGYGTTVLQNGASQTLPMRQLIDRSGFNRLSLGGLCLAGDGGLGGLDSATAFSMDPLTCAPAAQQCGQVTLKYTTGTGTLAQATLTMTLNGAVTGCGQTLGFTLTFTGTRIAGGSDAGVASAVPVDPGASFDGASAISAIALPR